MTVDSTRYVIATKKFPLTFDNIEREGIMTDRIERAALYYSIEEAINEIKNFDKPELYQPIKVNVTYEI